VIHLLPILVFVLLIGAAYVLAGRNVSSREGAAFVLAIAALFPLWDGGLMLLAEYGRWQHGRVVAGVVVGKLSSTGAEGSRTIGGRLRWRASRRFPTVLTAHGFSLHDVLARMIVTGSTDAWMVEYRYPCDSARGCWQREEVSHALWSGLQVGQAVNVRTAKGQNYSGRLDANPPLHAALARLAIGGTLGLFAGFVSGRLTRRGSTFVLTPAIVTSVERGRGGGDTHWRVGFSYVTADGTAYESADEVYISGVQPGDTCTAVYPPDHPDLGTLRLNKPISV
jgi:hypothetical protein